MVKKKAGILYIEGEDINRRTFVEFVSGEYNLYFAGTGKDGLEILKDKEVHVLVYAGKPRDDAGLKFMREVANLYPMVRRIALVRDNDKAEALHTVKEGIIHDYVTMPPDPEHLAILMKTSIEIFNLAQKNTSLENELLNTTLELRNQNQLSQGYRNLYDSIGDSIIIEDPERRITGINPVFTTLFGYKIDEIEGKPASILYAGIKHYRKIGESLAEKQRPENIFSVIKYKKKGGEIFPAQVALYPLKDEAGKNGRIIVMIRDISELVNIRQKLLNSEKQFKGLIENIPGAVYQCRMDKDWTMLYLNRNIKLISGYPASDFIGNKVRSFSSIICPEDAAGVEKQIRQALNRKNGRYKLEYRIIHKKGKTIWVLEQGKIIRDPEGNVDHLDGVILDISIRKKALRELERERYLVNAFLNNVPDNIYFKDLGSKFIKVNKSMASYFGYKDPDKLIGLSDGDLFSDEHANQALADEQKIINTGKSITKEEYETWPDGRSSWVSTVKLPLMDEEEEIIGTYGISKDITDRKRAEELTKLNEERLQSLLNLNQIQDASEEKIMDYALEEAVKLTQSKIGYLRFISKDKQKTRFFRLLNNSPEDHKKKVAAKIPEELEGVWTNSLRRKKPVIQNNFRKNQEKIGTVTLQISRHMSTPVLENGKVVVVAGVCNKENPYHNTDQSQLTLFVEGMWELLQKKQRELELKEAKDQAESANRAKSEFLANMSHEIRTPMNAVIGYTDLLEPMVKDEIQVDYINSIRSSGNALLQLIDDILDLSKVEAGKLEMQFEFINSRYFFEELKNIFSFKIEQKGLEFNMEISSSIPEAIYIDETRLRQILVNLLGNAIKFTEKGCVNLRVWTENPQILEYSKDKIEEYVDLGIEVEDTGIGISSEFQEIIFESFRQQEGQISKKYGGTGLGLAITKRLVEMMNGRISLESTLEKGSCFHILIPDVSYRRELEQTTKHLYLDAHDVVFDKALILVIDDVENNRKFLIDALSSSGLEVMEAATAEAGLKIALETTPDLIIVDIRMPGMDGFEFLEKVKNNRKLKKAPVIAYSASVLKSQKERILQSDFSGFIMKPVRIAELYVELMQHLGHRIQNGTVKDTAERDSRRDPEKQILDQTGLMKTLHKEMIPTWEKFAKRQPRSEIRQFSDILIKLGERHRAEELTEYGRQLISALDGFNIEKLLNLLNQFEVMVQNLSSDK